ncbi:hypothetical protein BCR42DRAFT_402449 [Absidia repens]|uniref:Uncharacterized protein n=1 Tax=Absidia repens TaxID=90262 RepID=A0A1X2IXZ9_9FUNG|nr:hypothetical protein BCR42DRAFT_402449 [Absidia repens]
MINFYTIKFTLLGTNPIGGLPNMWNIRESWHWETFTKSNYIGRNLAKLMGAFALVMYVAWQKAMGYKK